MRESETDPKGMLRWGVEKERLPCSNPSGLSGVELGQFQRILSSSHVSGSAYLESWAWFGEVIEDTIGEWKIQPGS